MIVKKRHSGYSGWKNYRIDIDVANVVNYTDTGYFSINPLLWKLRWQTDDRIEPILIEKDFDDSNFFEEIQKYGIWID